MTTRTPTNILDLGEALDAPNTVVIYKQTVTSQFIVFKDGNGNFYCKSNDKTTYADRGFSFEGKDLSKFIIVSL